MMQPVTGPNSDSTQPEPARRYGVTLPLPGLALHEHSSRVHELVDLGYHELWTGEGAELDAFVPLAMAAAWVRSLRLCTGIVPAFTRGPAVLAQTAAAMCQAAPGRFVLGLGSSSSTIVAGWNGQPYERPLQRVRDVLRFLRAAMRGDKITETYDTFSIRGFRLGVAPPEHPPRLLVAGLQPRMLELGGSEGDGVIVNWMSADDLACVRPAVRPGRELVARIKVLPSTDRDEVRRVASRQINAYFHVDGYRRSQEWLGRGDLLGDMWGAWASGDRNRALTAVPDEVIDQLYVWGDDEAMAAGIDRYFANGATSVVPAIIAPAPEAWATIQSLAPARMR